MIWAKFRKWLGTTGADDSFEMRYRQNLADLSRAETTWKQFTDGLRRPAPQPYVEVFMYWRIARDGTPTVSICDDPMSHPHAHLVRIPIPEDVQKCVAATKDPPLCMVLTKFGKHEGPCPQTSNETGTK
jgi:hypothetical protein